jgi:hypothetical protein
MHAVILGQGVSGKFDLEAVIEFLFQSSGFGSVLHVLSQVNAKVTAVTGVDQVRQVRAFGVVAQVRRGQNHAASGPFRHSAVSFFATARPSGRAMEPALSDALATVAGTGADFSNKVFPMGRINSLGFHALTFRGGITHAD